MLDLIRKIVGMVLTVAAILAIITLVIGGGETFKPLIDTFKPFDWKQCGAEINALLAGRMGIPLLMLMMGLIGWSFDDAK
jgi:TRAP-type C4-dicarboxylate transport system permease small subunit